MEKKIFKYINSNQVLTFSTSIDNQSYCALCFYVFDEANHTLIFLSDKETRHIKVAMSNSKVSGTITNDEISISKLRGIQFLGEFIVPDKLLTSEFYDKYYKRFPFARMKPSPIWGIKLSYIKMTDNTLGFGKKIIWQN